MKIKQIALFTLTAAALSGCSIVQAVTDVAGSTLEAITDGITGDGKRYKNLNDHYAQVKARAMVEMDERSARSRANVQSLNYQYFHRNLSSLVDLFHTQLLLSMDANTYAELDNEITELNKAIAAKQQGRATYRPPEFYDQCTAYMNYYMGRNYFGSDCVNSVTLRYTLEERRADYQETIAKYNQDIATLQQQRDNLLRFVQQKYGSMQNLKARIAKTQQDLSAATRNLNAHCPALMNGKPYVEIAIKPIEVNGKRVNVVPVRADSVFCGRDIIAYMIKDEYPTMDRVYGRSAGALYSEMWKLSQQRTGLKPVDPYDDDDHPVFGLFVDR